MGCRALLLLMALLLVPLLGRPIPAGAQSVRERITAYRVDITVQPNGALAIIEEIDYDFGSTDRHGILRDIPTKLRYDDRYDRDYPLTIESVRSSSGAPSGYATESVGGGVTRIRIGDANKTITGAQKYRIAYRIAGTMNAFDDHDELYWNAIGTEWNVPVVAATVTVHFPGGAGEVRVTCYAGSSGSRLPCASASVEGDSARFTQPRLGRYEGVSIVVGFPKGRVPEPKPVLIERWSFTRAFAIDARRLTAAVFVLAASVYLGIRLVWTRGRDLRWSGSPVEVVFGGTEQQRVPLFEGGAYAIEYTPPDDIRPGEVGTLVDEVAHPLDVTASIIDLAARDYLHIQEIPKEGWLGSTDWRLTKQPEPKERRTLQAFERRLLDGLFEDGDEVLLSSLKRTFIDRLHAVQEALYKDVVERGWFSESPDSTRSRWGVIAAMTLVLAIGLVMLTAWLTTFAIVPVPLVFAALLFLALHKRIPRRTAKGTSALRRTLGFRQYIETAETRRSEFAEKAGLFYEYLPYAIVFGCVERWSKAFDGLDLPAPDWYGSTNAFTAVYFASAMGGFSDTTVSAIVSTPGGSGSSGFSGGGFSGGGGGGGGGGSW